MIALETLFAFVVLLTVLIFVHELGHFAVARWCGVRVLKFSVGFGKPIGFGKYRLRWKRGHTEYVIAAIPLGGFVKMLGENPDEEDSPEARANPEEALNAKALWQKLAVVFAGPVMNLILPVVIIAGMLAVGIPAREAVVGLVERGSPAEAAGLEAGDRITAIAGEPVEWWNDASRQLRERPDEPVEIAYERAGEAGATTVRVGTRTGLNEFGKLAELGWTGMAFYRPGAVLAPLGVDSAAVAAGLQTGDLVTAVDGAPEEDWYGLKAAYAAASGETVAFEIKRAGEEGESPVALSVPALGSLDALGVVYASAVIAAVEPDAPAARAGLEAGDLILEYGGKPIAFFASFASAVASSAGESMPLVFLRDGERHEIAVAAESITAENGFGIDETRYRIGIRGGDGALVQGRIGIEQVRNPFVAIPRAVGRTVDITARFLEGLGMLFTGEVSRKSLAGPIGIAKIAGDAYRSGWENYLNIMILISINLGILNLLPIPVLDGGQALLFTVEGIKRSPLSLRAKLAVQQVGITMLLLLMGLAFWNDITRYVVDWLPGGF
jgi:regulator of sigma E protease